MTFLSGKLVALTSQAQFTKISGKAEYLGHECDV